MRALRHLRRDSHGTATVETALVLPVYLVLLFAIVEFGHAQLVVSLLQSGCRNGARMGALEGPTTEDVIDRVNRTIGSAVAEGVTTVAVRDASVYDTGDDIPETAEELSALPEIEVATAEPRQMFVVRATVPYNSIALVPMPFLRNLTLSAQAFMRHE
jgi:Flp pilus assembly protein TadG